LSLTCGAANLNCACAREGVTQRHSRLRREKKLAAPETRQSCSSKEEYLAEQESDYGGSVKQPPVLQHKKQKCHKTSNSQAQAAAQCLEDAVRHVGRNVLLQQSNAKLMKERERTHAD